MHKILILLLALSGCAHKDGGTAHYSYGTEEAHPTSSHQDRELLASFAVPAKGGGTFEVKLLGTRFEGSAHLQNIVVSSTNRKPQILEANEFIDQQGLHGESIDVDFDGHADFRVLVSLGATGNRTFNYWIFNPRKQLFETSSQLSDMGITSVDSIAKTLSASWNSGACRRSTMTYRYSSGRYYLTAELETGMVGELRQNPLYAEALEGRDATEIVQVIKSFRRGNLANFRLEF